MQIAEERVADDDILVIREAKNARGVTVLLRGANDFMLDETERSVHDALCVVKRVLESPSVVPGGGKQWLALSLSFWMSIDVVTPVRVCRSCRRCAGRLP